MKRKSPLERRIEIVKLLQGTELRTGDLANHFGVAEERTIRADLEALRNGLDVFGTIIQIESKHYDGNPRQYYKSTVHPIMLALNLSELFALLKLLENSEDYLCSDIYRHIFDCVYSQMTPYAEVHIAGKLKRRYKKADVIRNMPEEEAFRKNRDYQLIYWQKSGRSIEITYLKDGKPVTANARLKDLQGKKIEAMFDDGTSLWLDYGDVLIDWSRVEYK